MSTVAQTTTAQTTTAQNRGAATAGGDFGGKSGARAAKNAITGVVMWACFFIAMVPLVWILFVVLREGSQVLISSSWWTQSQANMTSRITGGGAYHAIMGTLLMALVTSAISVPIGIFTAIYLVEYGRGRLARAVSFAVDILTGVPSIVAGLFVYAVLITSFGGQRTGFASSLALMLLMIPVIVRSTEEMLKLVPNELREASYALGVPKWKTIAAIVLPTASGGIVTGVLLGLARVMGETAPLLILTPYTQFINVNLFSGYLGTLPTMINQERTEALGPAIERSWGAALTLILIILLLNVAGRLVAYFGKLK